MTIFDICRTYFCCPICKGEISVLQFGELPDGEITCHACYSNFIIFNNIPVMLPWKYVDESVKNEFLKNYSGSSTAVQYSAANHENDSVKEHQIHTWSNQYAASNIGTVRERTLPLTKELVCKPNLFHKNTRRLLYSIVTQKRDSGTNRIFLDIGCGEGAFIVEGSQNFQLYFGMDISYQAILNCYRKYPFLNRVFFVGDAENLPLKSTIVDVSGAQWLFEHLQNPAACAAEIARVLTPDGVVYVDTNNRNFTFTFRYFQMKLRPHWYWRRMDEAGHSHDRFFTAAQLKDIFSGVGFSLASVRNAYFLVDMLVSVFVLPFIEIAFTGVGSVPEEPNNGKRVQEAVSHLVIMNYECKSNFQIHSSERKAVKRFLQIILNIFHYMIVPDRILEVFGLSEGLVLVAVKKRA